MEPAESAGDHLQKGGTFRWSTECETGFVQLREALWKALVLKSPDVTKPFIIDTRGMWASVPLCHKPLKLESEWERATR